MFHGLIALLLITGFYVKAQAQTPAESCLDTVKSFLSSSEYNGEENIERIRSACLGVETRCVQLVGESLSSSERREAATFLPLVKSCAGTGKADCYNSILETTPSFDRSSATQAASLLKKCETSRQ